MTTYVETTTPIAAGDPPSFVGSVRAVTGSSTLAPSVTAGVGGQARLQFSVTGVWGWSDVVSAQVAAGVTWTPNPLPVVGVGFVRVVFNGQGQAQTLSISLTVTPYMDTGLKGSGGVSYEDLDADLASTFAPRSRGNYGPRWVFDGDSVTINSITTDNIGNQNRQRSWTTEMARLSNGRIQYVYNAAVAGQRIDQALARFDTVVAPQTPHAVLLTAGTNDVGQARSMALWLADVGSYLAKCKAIGAALIVGEIWPTNETSVIPTRGAITRTWNQALYAWAATNDVQVIRWSAVADPITGGWPAAWTADLIHPTLLDSYSQIGAFGWASIEPKAGPAYTIPRAVINGEGLLTNGFFTTLGAVTTPPAGSTATGSTASGSLAAGTYSYKLTGRTFYGESLPSSAVSATNGSTGQVSIAFTTPSGARGVNIYRKAPGDADWLFLVYAANGTSPYVDTGAATPAAAITGVDTSATPSGVTHGTSLLRLISGSWVFTETGIRGNVIRLRQSGGADQDYVFGNVTAGVTYYVTCLIRGSGAGEGSVYVRWRDAVGGSGGAVAQTVIYQQRFTAGWGLVYLKVTAPAGALSGRISFETDSTVDYMDVAEVLFTTA